MTPANADPSPPAAGGRELAAEGPLLELRHAAKAFGAVQAVIDASFELRPGEAHALVGENGAGKSTLVKILAGVHQPDSGTLLIGGVPAVLPSPAAAASARIAVIYQEPTLFPDLTVAENIFMGRQPLRRGRRIDTARMRAQAAALFARLGVGLDPGRICRGLSIADQQLVEIAKALSLDARIIVMDEPTAALSAVEVTRLFDVIRALRAGRAAVLFISHRLEEVFGVCQRVTVLRDGRLVLTRELAGLTADDLVRAMVGRQLAGRDGPAGGGAGPQVLRVDRLTREGVFTDVSFEVRAGEIVALAGLVGAGRSEVARAVFGIDRYDAGSVTVQGRPLRKSAPTSSMNAGVGFVPEDRRQQGLIMGMSVQQNVALASLRRLRRGGFITAAAERKFAADWALRLRIKASPAQRPGGRAVRRQSAEGRAGPVARPAAGRADRGRADPGHRHRDQGRGAPAARPAGRRRGRDLDDLLGAARGPAAGRPGAGHARGTADRRVRPRRSQRGDDHGRGHRPAPGAGAMSRTLTAPKPGGPPPAAASSRKLTERVFRIRESGIIVVLALFVLVTASVQHRFLNSQNIQFVLVNTTVFALLALGETMVVVSRNYDLSVGSVLGLSAYLSASLFSHAPGLPVPVVFAAGLGIGLACGAGNGLMVAVGRVPSLVVTLATLYIIRGIDILIVGGNEVVARSLPGSFIAIPQDTVLGIPCLAIVIAAVIGAGAYYLRTYRSGRELYAIGSNPEAARLAGLPVARRVFTAFAVSGAIAGVAGVLWAAQYQTIDSTAGTGYELQVVAAVVVGGVAIFGGSGSAVGAAIGALLLNTINSALNVLGISPFWDQAIAGFLLLLAITLDRLISARLVTALRLRSAHHGT